MNLLRLKSLFTLLLLVGLPLFSRADDRPNVILIMTDDQGYGDLGCHGNPIIKTPHLDRMHSESVRFTDFHVSSFCTPTRAALMTGNYPAKTGAYRTSAGRTMMHPDERTIAHHFSENGYATGMVGKWHLGDNAPHRPQDRGFQDVVWHRCGGIGQASDYWGNDYFDDTYERNGKFEKFEGYCTDVWFREGMRFVSENKDQPFFLYLALNAPHGPYRVPPEWAEPYKGVEGVVNPNFMGMVTNIDHNMGLLREHLDALNLTENTILIFMTDNGTSAGAKFNGLESEPVVGFNGGMRGKKSSVYEGGHRVPFFIHWPNGGLIGGKDIDNIAAHIDVLPTLAELCSLPKPDASYDLDGLSLVPLLKGEEEDWPRKVHVEQYHCGPHNRLPIEPFHYTTVLTEKWRMVKASKEVVELYDIENDRAQLNNLAEQHPDVVAELKKHYETYWEKVHPRMTPVSIDIGNPDEPVTELCSQDWFMLGGNPPWNFGTIRKLPKVTLPWKVNVRQAGRYKFTLRQMPKVAGLPVQARRARIEIAGQQAESEVEPGSKGVIFELDLPTGKTDLKTYLYDENDKAGGAFFTEVEFVGVEPKVSTPGRIHAVIVVGTHHYSPQRSMPSFAKELERLGISTTVVSPDWDPEKDKRGLPGLEALDSADVAVFFTRFLKLEDDQLAPITRYLESGNPVVGFRTSTHGFNYPKEHPRAKWNKGFGKDVLGTPYLIHLAGATQLRIAGGAKGHPILTGVGDPTDWVSPGTLYLTKLESGITPLLMGTGKSRSKEPSVRTNQFGTHQLQPEMTDTVAWTWTNKWGGRTFSTSLGHIGDFAVPESLRLMVNGVFWAAGLPVPSGDTVVKPLDLSSSKTKERHPAAKKPAPKFSAATPAQTVERDDQTMDVAKIDSGGVTLFYGNSFVERLQEDGTMEALLHASDPDRHYQFRSLAYTGDEVGFRIRPAKFGNHLGYISSQLNCDRVVMCFGMNESFAGADGLAAFERDLRVYLDLIKGRHPGSEYVLVSPTAVEVHVDRNTDIERYCQIMAKVANELGVEFVDLFGPSKQLFDDSLLPLTQNGLHLNEEGNRLIAQRLADKLGGKTVGVDTSAPGFERLRELVSRKAYEVAMAYKPANGIHYYGLRAREYEYAAEIPHHLNLANELDKAIWKQAKDLTKALPMPDLATAEAVPPQKPPRKGLGIIKTAEQDLRDFTVAEGFEVNAFASSEDFPDLINPLQIHTDGKGRMWVCCFASYPVPLPGALANDKILILEDTDGDGRADKQTVFADQLKLPDGFVFYKDGIVVSVARKLIWLRDTDGDDVADVRTELLRGADDTDTHHGGYLSRTPQGDIILTEALFHRGQFETPQGPLRTKNVAILHFDPVSRGLSIARQTSHPNPWKISWNNRGEAIQMYGGGQIIDCDYYDVDMPIGTSSGSAHGMPFRDDKGCTIEFVSSSHFPEDWQGGVVTGHLLGKNTVLYTPLEYRDGVMAGAATPMPLLTSSNKIFRPTDLEFGLDGALYVSDFYYPIIGHAQHSIRDENRDYSNGRIWRVTRKGAPLSTAPRIAGAKIADLFSLLTHPQVTVRELARYELERQPDDEVLAYAKSQLPAGNLQLGLEILWLFERLGDKAGIELFKSLVDSDEIEIVRAGTKSLRHWNSDLGDQARVIAGRLASRGDHRTLISLISTASYLQATDPWWAELIQGIPGESGSSIDKMKQLASLYDAPPLSREFPLLSVSPDCNLTDWLPTDVGIGGGSMFVTSEKSQSVILGFRGNPYLNVNFNGIPLYREAGSVHVKDGQMTIDLVKGINHIEYFEKVKGKRGSRIDLYLADLTGEVPDDVRIAKDLAEHQSWAKTWNDKYATVTDSRIYIKAVPSQMAFNVKTFTVEPGKEYQFVFDNPDHMLHNIVITKQGRGDAVGYLADKMAAQPDGMAKHFVPENDAVLFSTEQIPHGARVEKTFVTPKEPGRYPFICTFPGHWRLMRGEMIVAAEKAETTVSIAPNPQSKAAAAKNGSALNSSPIPLPEVRGRFVRIELPGEKRTLSLAEVEVFEKGVNLAFKGKAAQSTVAHSGTPEKAVDGNTNGDYHKGSVTHSKPNSTDPWWEVDLGKEADIEGVVVYNRDSLGGRLDGFTLKILDAARKVVFSKEKIRQSDLIAFEKPGQVAYASREKGSTPVRKAVKETYTREELQKAASEQPPNGWLIDNDADWALAVENHANLEFADGMVTPIAQEATFRSRLKSFDKPRALKSIRFDQSPVWHNWDPIGNLGPNNLGDAPVMLSLGPDNYWMFGRYGGKGKKGFTAVDAHLEGFDIPLKTTPFPNQYDAPGGLLPGRGGYHAWQSRDMINWVHHGAVTEKFSCWVTTAEYADGKLFIYYDYPNDQDPHLYIDADLTDGIPGKNMGMAFEDPSHGSDCTFIRDLDGNFHVIYEDWSPIDASKHSWDSPLAGHAMSKDGIGNFKILDPAVDERTRPTGKFAEYPHPHWHATDPERYPAKEAPEDVSRHRIKKGQPRAYGRYEIHEPEQNAYGDWASICIGGQYYLFADYHPANDKIRVGWFTSSGIGKPFTFCGEIGRGHPDPDIMFAEGKFYLATQQSIDYISSGPWVEAVEVRVGVDTNNDGEVNQWTAWREVKESYDYTDGFSKQIAKKPAELELSSLPEGFGFQFEVRMTDSTENESKPILDAVELSFEE